MTAQEAEKIVKRMHPNAYCNNWRSQKGLRWWICSGVYQDQRSIGPKRLTPDSAWLAAAARISESEDGK